MIEKNLIRVEFTLTKWNSLLQLSCTVHAVTVQALLKTMRLFYLASFLFCGRVLKSSLRNRLCLSAKPFPLLFGQEGGDLLKYSAVVIIEHIQGLRSQAGGLDQG